MSRSEERLAVRIATHCERSACSGRAATKRTRRAIPRAAGREGSIPSAGHCGHTEAHRLTNERGTRNAERKRTTKPMNATRSTTENDLLKIGPCDCSPEAEQWTLEESPLDGDDSLGFYRCETCGTLHCIDGTTRNA